MPKRDVGFNISAKDDGASVSINRVGGALDGLDDHSKSASNSMAGLWKEFAKGMGVVRLAEEGLRKVAQAVSEGITEASGFQQSFSNVNTLIDVSAQEMEAMQKEVLGLAGELGSATELTDGLYQALSAGVEPARAVGFVGDAAKFAKAALVDTKTSVDVLTTAINAYGLKASDATAVSDTLFQVIKDGKTTGGELAGSLGRVIPSAAALGVDLKELGGAMAVLTKGGIQTTEAVTSLNSVFMSILKPTEDTKKAAEELGIEWSKIGIEKAGGLQQFLLQVKNGLEGNEEAIARLVPNVEGLKAALSLTGTQAQEYAAEMERMKEVSGNTEEAFRKQMENMNAQLEAVKNKIQAVFTEMILPVLKDFAIWIKENQDGIIGFFKQVSEVILALGKVAFFATDKLNKLQGVMGGTSLSGDIKKLAKIRVEFLDGMEKGVWALDDLMEQGVSWVNKGINALDDLGKTAETEARKVGEVAKQKKLTGTELLAITMEELRIRADEIEMWEEEEKAAKENFEQLEKGIGVLEGYKTGVEETRQEVDSQTQAQARLGEEIDRTTLSWDELAGMMQVFNALIQDASALLDTLGINLSGVTEVAGGFAQFFSSKDLVGKIGGALKVLGGLAKAIKDLFSGDGVGEAIARENAWMRMNDSLKESLHKLAEEVGNTHAATSMMLSDIMAESDITVGNFESWARRVKEIFIDLDRGYLNQKEFAQEMGEAWNALLGEAERLGTEGSFEMLSIIREMRNRGMEIKEITEYVSSQLDAGAEAFGNYLDSISGKGGYTRASTYLTGLISAYQAEGRSLGEIFDQIGDEIDRMKETATAGGYDTGMLDQIFGLRDFYEKNKGVMQGIEASRQMLEAFGNTGYMTQQIFSTAQQDALGFYKKLTAGGQNEKAALEAMAPMLAKQIWYAEQYGFELDDQVKKLIEKGKAEGINFDAMLPHEERMLDLQTKQLEVLERIEEMFARQLPGAMDKTLDSFRGINAEAAKLARAGKYQAPDVSDMGKGGWNPDIRAAAGWSGWVNRRTLFEAGEGLEPEYVNVIPRSKMEANGSPGGQTYNVTVSELHVNEQVSTLTVAQALTRALSGNVAGAADAVRQVYREMN